MICFRKAATCRIHFIRVLLVMGSVGAMACGAADGTEGGHGASQGPAPATEPGKQENAAIESNVPTTVHQRLGARIDSVDYTGCDWGPAHATSPDSEVVTTAFGNVNKATECKIAVEMTVPKGYEVFPIANVYAYGQDVQFKRVYDLKPSDQSGEYQPQTFQGPLSSTDQVGECKGQRQGAHCFISREKLDNLWSPSGASCADAESHVTFVATLSFKDEPGSKSDDSYLQLDALDLNVGMSGGVNGIPGWQTCDTHERVTYDPDPGEHEACNTDKLIRCAKPFECDMYVNSENDGECVQIGTATTPAQENEWCGGLLDRQCAKKDDKGNLLNLVCPKVFNGRPRDNRRAFCVRATKTKAADPYAGEYGDFVGSAPNGDGPDASGNDNAPASNEPTDDQDTL